MTPGKEREKVGAKRVYFFTQNLPKIFEAIRPLF